MLQEGSSLLAMFDRVDRQIVTDMESRITSTFRVWQSNKTNMNAIRAFEKLERIYHSKRRTVPKYINCHQHGRENLVFHSPLCLVNLLCGGIIATSDVTYNREGSNT